MSDKSWILDVKENEDGEKFIELTDEILELSNFKIGDNLEWTDRGDGSWSLKKKEEKTWALVEAVHTFRMRYVFSQEFIGQQIMSHRVISEEDALKLCDVDNYYCAKWDNQKKIETFFTEEGFERED